MPDLHTRLLASLTERRQVADDDRYPLAVDLADVMRVVVELHEPVPPSVGTPYHTCCGCDWGDYADGPPGWPCRTIKAVAEALGVEATDG